MKGVFAPRWLFEKTSGITRFVIEMAFTALASDYKDFAAEGYRWVKSMAHLCALLKRISER